jgi:hypothetical protein
MKQIGTGKIADGAVTSQKTAQNAIVPEVTQLSTSKTLPPQTSDSSDVACPAE